MDLHATVMLFDPLGDPAVRRIKWSSFHMSALRVVLYGNMSIGLFCFPTKKNNRLDVARVNETTNSYTHRFNRTCPPEPACSHFWLREHIHYLSVRKEHIYRFSASVRSREHVDKLELLHNRHSKFDFVFILISSCAKALTLIQFSGNGILRLQQRIEGSPEPCYDILNSAQGCLLS